MKEKQKYNLLDFIPVKKNCCNYRIDDKSGIVIIDVRHKGFYNKAAQKLFHKPAVSHISLDDIGSFVFLNINGINTVYDLSDLLNKEFGKDAEPIIERLVMYIKILKSNHFIELHNGSIKIL